MKKKNVLIVSYSYPPSNAPAAQRPYSLAKYLNKKKYTITVITCSNADSSLGFDSGFNEKLPEVTLIKIKSKIGTNASKYRESGMVNKTSGFFAMLKSNIFLLGTILTFPDKAIFWYPNVIKYLRENNDLITKTDIVFTTSPLFTNHLIGNYIYNKNKLIKWIADFRDFHYIENWSNKKNIKSKLNKRLESKIITNANKIIFVSETMMKVYASYYKSAKNKMDFIYNGFDKDDFKDLTIAPVANKKLTIFYAGSFYKGVRSPFPLLDLLDISFKKKYLSPDEVIIKIAGNFEQELLEKAKTYKSFSCIKFLGRIPRTKVLNQLTKADLLWLIVGDKVAHYKAVPIKFYEYLAARRPILNFAPDKSESTKIIKEYDLGLSFNSENNIGNKEVALFNELLQKYKKGLLKNPLEDKTISKFTRNKQTLAFERLIDG